MEESNFPYQYMTVSPGQKLIPIKKGFSPSKISPLDPAEIVLQPDDVIFSEIISVLDFYEYKGVLSRVIHPVGGHLGDINGLSRGKPDLLPFQCNNPFAFDHDPMLSSLFVLLIAQSFTWEDFNSLDFVGLPIFQNRIASPWAMFCHRRSQTPPESFGSFFPLRVEKKNYRRMVFALKNRGRGI